MCFYLQENFSRSLVGEMGQNLNCVPSWGATFGVEPPCSGLCGLCYCTVPLVGIGDRQTDPACASLGFAAGEVTSAGILISLFLGDVT